MHNLAEKNLPRYSRTLLLLLPADIRQPPGCQALRANWQQSSLCLLWLLRAGPPRLRPALICRVESRSRRRRRHNENTHTNTRSSSDELASRRRRQADNLNDERTHDDAQRTTYDEDDAEGQRRRANGWILSERMWVTHIANVASLISLRVVCCRLF